MRVTPTLSYEKQHPGSNLSMRSELCSQTFSSLDTSPNPNPNDSQRPPFLKTRYLTLALTKVTHFSDVYFEWYEVSSGGSMAYVYVGGVYVRVANFDHASCNAYGHMTCRAAGYARAHSCWLREGGTPRGSAIWATHTTITKQDLCSRQEPRQARISA